MAVLRDIVEVAVFVRYAGGDGRRFERAYGQSGLELAFFLLELPSIKQQHEQDDGNGEYVDYCSKTELGKRYDTITALYGSVNLWSLWKYWHGDSIIKQTIMLADKSGLRKRKDMVRTGGVKPKSSDEEINNLWAKTFKKNEDGRTTI